MISVTFMSMLALPREFFEYRTYIGTIKNRGVSKKKHLCSKVNLDFQNKGRMKLQECRTSSLVKRILSLIISN